MATEINRATNISWRKFLATEAGQIGMLSLRERVPPVTKGESHSIAFDAGRAQGFKECLDAISEIIGVVEEKLQDIENR